MQDDPLSQLRDVHLPDAPGLWPPAPGWWLLLLIVIVALCVLTVWALRRWRRGQARREALTLLDLYTSEFRSGALDGAAYASNVNALLKRLWVRAQNRANLATLTGQAWLEYLDERSNSKDFTQGPGQALGDARFQAQSITPDPALHKVVATLLKRSEAAR